MERSDLAAFAGEKQHMTEDRKEERRGFTVVLDAVPPGAAASSAPADAPEPYDPRLPARLREMMALYEYGPQSFQAKCRNFCRQAVYMADYEDDCPWRGEWRHYFPTYHDMNLRQLRGYFTWRAQIRRGVYRTAASGFAYVYLYELLNGVGAASAEDVLQKMREFEAGYLDSGLGEPALRPYLRRWMLEFAVLHALPPDTARQYADPVMLARDEALSALKTPEEHTDEAVFQALCAFAESKTAESPVVAADPARGIHLFAEVWRRACAMEAEKGRDLFQTMFGTQALFNWRPLSNAVYWVRHKSEDVDYVLNECRSYRCRNGVWQEARYDGLSFDRDALRALLHEADRQLRRYRKTGRYLRPKPDEAWAAPYAEAAIAAEREAARPKLRIDLSGLDRIRRDALTTRDSLLTEEDRRELAESAPPEQEKVPKEAPRLSPAPPSLLDEPQTRILLSLLRGEAVAEVLRERHLLSSVVADAINEALFDEIGDAVVDCDGSTLSIVEDYREELERLLGGDNR